MNEALGLKKHQFFAGGEWHDPASGEWFSSDNPATGKPWALIPRCGEEDINLAVQAAHGCFTGKEWRGANASARGALLRRMHKCLVKHADLLGGIETKDNGKRTADITPGLKTWLADSFEYYAGLADKLEGAVIPVDAPNIFNYTRREPYGVCALITAWNSPLLIAIWKLAPALAAGNTVVLKPSEHASASTLALIEVFSEADMPPGLVNVVTGYGSEAGDALVRHDMVRLVSFTGGISGGQAVATAAADGVKPTILELGGKSPQIVLEDADLDLAVNGIAAGIFPPAGQSCIAGSRALVHESLHDELVERLCAVSEKARLGDPCNPKTHIGPIANKPHYERVLRNIDAARASGAKCVLGGEPLQPEGLAGWFIPPTIFTDVSPASDLAREEIFGPVLAIIPFSDEEEAVHLANDTSYGLAAGIWTRDSLRAMKLAERIEAGTIYINNYFNSAPQSPVGGYKQSGYGRENGVEGLEAYLQTKSVWLSTHPTQSDPFAT